METSYGDVQEVRDFWRHLPYFMVSEAIRMSESDQKVFFCRSIITPATVGFGEHTFSPVNVLLFVPNINQTTKSMILSHFYF